MKQRSDALNEAQESIDQFHANADDLDSWTRDAVADLEKVRSDMAKGERLDAVYEEFEVKFRPIFCL